MINRLIVPLTLAVFAAGVGPALAQGAFPAPLPGQAAAQPTYAPQPNDPAFPPVNGRARANDPAFPPVNGRARANDPAFPPVNGRAPVASVGAPMASFPSGGAAPIAGNPTSFAPAPPTQ